MQNSSHASTAENAAALRKVKLLHTVAWAFFAGCILLVPLAAWQRRFDVALVLIMIVTVAFTRATDKSPPVLSISAGVP